MGVCLSREERELRERSAAIDRLLDDDNKKFRKECKILLLGMLDELASAFKICFPVGNLTVFESSNCGQQAAASRESLPLSSK